MKRIFDIKSLLLPLLVLSFFITSCEKEVITPNPQQANDSGVVDGKDLDEDYGTTIGKGEINNTYRDGVGDENNDDSQGDDSDDGGGSINDGNSSSEDDQDGGKGKGSINDGNSNSEDDKDDVSALN